MRFRFSLCVYFDFLLPDWMPMLTSQKCQDKFLPFVFYGFRSNGGLALRPYFTVALLTTWSRRHFYFCKKRIYLLLDSCHSLNVAFYSHCSLPFGTLCAGCVRLISYNGWRCFRFQRQFYTAKKQKGNISAFCFCCCKQLRFAVWHIVRWLRQVDCFATVAVEEADFICSLLNCNMYSS